MENKTKKPVIIILSAIILLGIMTLFFSLQSNAIKINPEMENNSSGSSSGSSNASKVNHTQNTTSLTKNTISIPLEKPPFIKD